LPVSPRRKRSKTVEIGQRKHKSGRSKILKSTTTKKKPKKQDLKFKIKKEDKKTKRKRKGAKNSNDTPHINI
jgi:hypothetical protein